MDFILYASVFASGYLFSLFMSYLLNLGQGMVLTKQAVDDCLIMFANASQKVREMNELSYFTMRKEGKSKDQIEIIERYDKMQIISTQNILIRNLITKIPHRYSNVFEFHNWDTAMEYLKTDKK